LGNYFGGAHWCAWEVFYDYCNEIGVRYTDEQRGLLNLWMEQSKHCHWWFPYDGIVLASERPTTLTVDNRGRLHSESGQAIGYSDGWGLYVHHGVQIPADIIEDPESITIDRIGGEANAEIRRVMIERYGSARYLIDSGAKIVHRDAVGILYRKDLPDDEPIVMVRVLNSTPEPDGVMSRDEAIAAFGEAAKAAIAAPTDARFKEYMLRVDPDLRPLHVDGTKGAPQAITARNAVASTFGLRGEDYEPYFES
jgi:hypothetical protein